MRISYTLNSHLTQLEHVYFSNTCISVTSGSNIVKITMKQRHCDFNFSFQFLVEAQVSHFKKDYHFR